MITINFYFLIILVCLLLSAFFSGSETALFSITKSELYNLAFSESRREHLIASIMERPRRILITILIGNMIVNIFMTTLFTNLSLQIFGEYGHFIAIAIVTPVIIVFCEIIPKVVALSAAVKISKKIIYLLNLFHKLFYPIRNMFLYFSIFLIKLFKLKTEIGINVSERELDIAVRLNESKGHIDKHESRFIKNVLNFSKKSAENVMIPRNRAIGISEKATIDEAIAIFKESGVMRAPVYRDDLDTIVGIIDSRDLIPYIYKIKKGKLIKRLIHDIKFYPESKELVELLDDFLKTKIQMAVLIDEYGGTSGIVTLSSIISEVMGERFNLDDSIQKPEVKTIRSKYIIDALMQLADFNERFDMQLESNEAETIGGYFTEQVGHFPIKGEFINFESYTLKVRSVRSNTIISLELLNI